MDQAASRQSHRMDNKYSEANSTVRDPGEIDARITGFRLMALLGPDGRAERWKQLDSGEADTSADPSDLLTSRPPDLSTLLTESQPSWL